jgi:endonuclease/exonuclease/phosphatase family protein
MKNRKKSERGQGIKLGLLAAIIGVGIADAAPVDGLRVACWNITNYSGGRQTDISNAVYAQFEGRSLNPDVFVLQEVLSQSGVNAFVSILNSAPGSPGDWVAGPFVNGPDTDNALFYRTSRIEFLGMTILPADGTSGAPRDVNRYDLALVGYDAPSTQLAIYSTHMKAGSGSSDQARRLIEARKIRDDAELLDPAIHIMVAGDYNIQSSSQTAYQELIGSQANNNGRFADPIATPGNWNNSFFYRFVHTQDPSGAGGMDDRYDQILIDPALGDGTGLEYRGVFAQTYSTTTWNDLSHSYRSWGNDGTSFNTTLTVAGNTMVGPIIAQALINVSGNAGHLPLFLDLVVPGTIAADTSIDLGQIPFGSVSAGQFDAGNGGDIALWGPTGIGDINYTLDADAGVTVPGGSFSDAPGGGLNTHSFNTDLATNPSGGPVAADIRVLSDDPDQPILTITLTGTIVGCSQADFAVPFGTMDFFDVQEFLDAFANGLPQADLTGEGEFNFFDVQEFLDQFSAGCP